MKIFQRDVYHRATYVILQRWSNDEKNSCFSFQLFHFIAYSQPCPLILYIHHRDKYNKIPALSNKLMEALRKGKQQSEQVRETNRAEVDGKRERKGINKWISSEGRGREEWLDFSFHGEHDFWREFRTSLKGSKLVRIQFTGPECLPRLPPPPPWSRRLFNPWKNRKNKFIFMKNIFQRVCIPSSLLLLFSSSLSLSLPISRPLNRIRRNKKKERERERAGDWNWREIERGGGGEIKSREKDRRYFRRRLVPEEQSPPPPLASLNYARSFISGGTSVPDIFQVRWVRRRPGKTVFVARRWACLLLGGKNREKNLECAMSRELEDTWRGEEDDREV